MSFEDDEASYMPIMQENMYIVKESNNGSTDDLSHGLIQFQKNMHNFIISGNIFFYNLKSIALQHLYL